VTFAPESGASAEFVEITSYNQATGMVRGKKQSDGKRGMSTARARPEAELSGAERRLLETWKAARVD